MSKSMGTHSSNNCCSEASTKSQAFVFNCPNSENESFHRSNVSNQFRFDFDRGLISSDSGLCAGFNNCNLINFSSAQLSSETPTLNPYFPPRDSNQCQPGSFEVFHASSHQSSQERLSRFEEQTSDSPPKRYQLNVPRKDSSGFVVDAIESAEYREKINPSVEFQDRSKKLNFCDQNRTVDECGHLDDNRKPSEDLPHPPKKKWIRHYMTGKE